MQHHQYLKHPSFIVFQKVNELTHSKSLLLCERVLGKYFGLNGFACNTQRKGKEIHIKSGRDGEKEEEGAREKMRNEKRKRGRKGKRGREGRRKREGENERRWGAETERQSFHTCRPRALKPSTPTPKPKSVSQNRFGSYFRQSPCPASVVPGALIHSCPLCTMTFEPGKIIALEQITYNR